MRDWNPFFMVKKTFPPPGDFSTDYSDAQIPSWDDNYSLAEHSQADPDYPF